MNWQSRRSHGRVGSRRGKQRIAVIGGGIVGLAHAWMAALRGHQVLLFERHEQAQSASIRNFGMIWPIGQPNGPDHRTAILSRTLWSELLEESGLWHDACGSLHLAYEPDEASVLEEFAKIAPPLGFDCEMLSSEQVMQRSAGARREGLLGGLWSPTEMCVDPRQIVAQMPRWLEKKYRVQLHFGKSIEHVSLPWVVASDGSRSQVDRVIVATGAEFQLLFPELFRTAGFRRCKLQMLRTVPQPNGWRLGPMIASGLTLRHYASFRICHSLAALKKRIATTMPRLDHYGIHVMASQNGNGEVVLGDSHEYDADISPFDKAEIDELMLQQLRIRIDLPDWTIQQRWHGIYAQLPGTVQFVQEVEPGVQVVIASGGCGMTMSFGLAEQLWQDWDDSPSPARHGNGSVPATPLQPTGNSNGREAV